MFERLDLAKYLINFMLGFRTRAIEDEMVIRACTAWNMSRGMRTFLRAKISDSIYISRGFFDYEGCPNASVWEARTEIKGLITMLRSIVGNSVAAFPYLLCEAVLPVQLSFCMIDGILAVLSEPGPTSVA